MRKMRALAIITVLVVGLLLILPYLVEGLEWPVVVSAALYLVGIFALVSLALMSPTPEKGKPSSQGGEVTELKTVTVLACYGCKHTEEREFQTGDYIGKVLGKCPHCKGHQYIRAIYAEEEKGKKS